MVSLSCVADGRAAVAIDARVPFNPAMDATGSRGAVYLDLAHALGPSPGYSYVARASGGSLVFTAGAVPLDREGSLVGPGDVVVQTKQAITNLDTALSAAGAGARDVLKTTVYVASADRADLVRVWDAFAESELSKAPSTLIGVATLGYAGQLVEIEAVALTDDGAASGRAAE